MTARDGIEGAVVPNASFLQQLSRSNLDALVCHYPDGLLFVDAAGRVEAANDAFCRLIGAGMDILRDLRVDEVEARLKARTAPSAPWAALDELEPWISREGRSPARDSLMQVARDRQLLTLSVPSEIVLERRKIEVSEASAKGTIFIFRDVTREAREARTKRDLVAAAAHEIRTPLSAVVGFSELLVLDQHPQEEKKEFVAMIHQHAVELSHLVDELLDPSRIEAFGIRTFKYRRENLGSLVESLLAGYGHNENRQRLQVTRKHIGDLEMLVDKEKLLQALRNILHNGLKYSSVDSTVKMKISRFEQAGRPFVRIDISDQGIGIAESDLARLFSPFARGMNVQHIPGTGLGLSLAKDIIRNHGGTINISSVLGEGTTVMVTLPVTAPQAVMACSTEGGQQC